MEAVQEGIDAELRRVLRRLSRRKRSGSSEPEQQVISRVELGDFTYVLTRIAHPVSLSPRQREIVRLVKEGLPNKAIAYRLGISKNTVGVHLQRIYRKLGVDSRASLAQKELPRHGE